jgi:hypothetical protein
VSGETGERPHSGLPIRRLRVHRLSRKVAALRAEIDASAEDDPIARLELLYRLADETEKLDRLTPRPPEAGTR